MTDAITVKSRGDNEPAADMIRSVIERVEALHAERKTLGDEVADIYKEAKSNGLDVRALREVVRRRGKDKNELEELEAVVELYMKVAGKK